VAYVEERPTGWLVVWRVSGTNRKRSRLVAWGGAADMAGGIITKDDARQRAEQIAAEMRQRERACEELRAQRSPRWNRSCAFWGFVSA
jgi:hypothetical protein